MRVDQVRLRTPAQLRRALERWLAAEKQPQNRLEALTTAVRLLRATEDVITQRVVEARSFGYSWADIARVVGITKQAANRRWRHLDEPAQRLRADRERRYRPPSRELVERGGVARAGSDCTSRGPSSEEYPDP